MKLEKVYCSDCKYYYDKYYNLKSVFDFTKPVCTHKDFIKIKHTPIFRIKIYTGKPKKINKNNDCARYIYRDSF